VNTSTNDIQKGDTEEKAEKGLSGRSIMEHQALHYKKRAESEPTISREMLVVQGDGKGSDLNWGRL